MRYIAFLLFCLLVCLTFFGIISSSGGNWSQPESRTEEYTYAEIEAISEQEQSLNNTVQHLGAFHRQLSFLKVELVHGRKTLRDAADEMVACAQQHNLRYLESLRTRLGPLTDRELMAVSLIYQIRLENCARNRLDEISEELCHWATSDAQCLAEDDPSR